MASNAQPEYGSEDAELSSVFAIMQEILDKITDPRATNTIDAPPTSKATTKKVSIMKFNR